MAPLHLRQTQGTSLRHPDRSPQHQQQERVVARSLGLLPVGAAQDIAHLFGRQRPPAQVLRDGGRWHQLRESRVAADVASDLQVIEERAHHRELKGDGRGALLLADELVAPPLHVLGCDFGGVAWAGKAEELAHDAAVSATGLFGDGALAEGGRHTRVEALGQSAGRRLSRGHSLQDVLLRHRERKALLRDHTEVKRRNNALLYIKSQGLLFSYMLRFLRLSGFPRHATSSAGSTPLPCLRIVEM